MEFKSLKDIETSFRQIRAMSTVFVSLCALVTGYVLWSSYWFAERQREEICVLDNGKSLILALSQGLSQDRPVEAKEHIRCFHELSSTLSSDKVVIESNTRRMLFLYDESTFRYYRDWKEEGYHNRMISASINQSIRVGSVVCDFNSHSYVVTACVRQSLARLGNITERNLVTRCQLLNSVRSDSNSHGSTMEQLNIVENRDLRTIER